MKITTGLYKNRKIVLPKGIRPTQDKVRKAIFDILGDISGLSFLELFAGSGAVGLEALSRGAAEVVFVESNRACLHAMQGNIDTFKARNCVVVPLESEAAIGIFGKKGKQFDIVFFDPPYYRDLAKKTLQTLGGYDIVAPHGLVVVQHFKQEALPKESGTLTLVKEYLYGDTALSIFNRGEAV